MIDAAGELFRNIVIMAEGPLNPPILGDFEDMPPQNWGLGGLKNFPELTIFPTVKFASNILEEAPNGWVVIRWRQDKPTPLPLPGGELNPRSRLGYLLSEIA